MGKKPKRAPDKKRSGKAPPVAKAKSQRERFIEKAREIEADESGKAFERAFKKIIPPARPQTG